MNVIEKGLVLNVSSQLKSKEEVFELIAKTVKEKHKKVEIKNITDALLKRESEGTTGVGEGTAIPHGSIEIDSPLIVVIRLDKAIDWNSIDNKKVDLIISILVPDNEDGRKEHFKLLTDFSRKMVDSEFKNSLKTGSEDEVVGLINSLSENKEESQQQVKKEGVLSIVAITSCATGIAHTYMAAEAIEKGAQAKGFNYKVEKRGGMGSENKLSKKDIEEADICIIASEVNIDPSLFQGKRLYVSSASEAIKMGDKYIGKAVKNAMLFKGDLQKSGQPESNSSFASEEVTNWKKIQKHLLFGVSWMLPLVVVSGITLGLVNVITSIKFEPGADWALWDGNVFMQPMIIFGQIGFGAMFAVFSAAVAYSIAGKPAAMPGFIAGMMIVNPDLIFIGYNWEFLEPVADAGITGGFFGAIFTGLFVGWAVSKLSEIKLHRYVAALMPVLIIPLFLSFFMFLIIKFVIGLPLALVMYGIYYVLTIAAEAGPAFIWIIGGVFGALCMVDLGGPVNKTAFAVSVALFVDPSGGFTEIWQPYAAFHMAIPIASLGAFFACFIRPSLFDEKHKVEATTAAAMGTFGISEGAIPICISNPKVWMPANMIGGFISGSLVVLCGIRMYGGVAGPLMVFLGSADSAYGALWTVFVLWPLITFVGAFSTAIVAILLLSLEKKREAEFAKDSKEFKKANEDSNVVTFTKEISTNNRVVTINNNSQNIIYQS